jgi:predicted GTPase
MVLERLKRWEEVEREFNLEGEFGDLKERFGIDGSWRLEEVLKKIEEEGRSLKIGVVGRVKGGKSSLLNCLFFEGREVLPKAATPMTASLTILEYRKGFGAEIELFSDEDLEHLRGAYLKYLEKLRRRREEEFQKLVAKFERMGKGFSREELLERAEKRAHRELKGDLKLVSAYQQYTQILNSPIERGQIPTKIEATSYWELKEKLKEYVGVGGRYTPFVKVVRMAIGERLGEGLEIVDTPGVNDPVLSREEKTRELLKECDVILILSPAGQFLAEEDLELLDRITNREGVREIYILASQIDTQLFGSERGETPFEAVENITNRLTQLAVEVLERDPFLRSSPVLFHLKKNRVQGVSAIAYSIYKKLERGEGLEPGEAKVLENLRRFYPSFFGGEGEGTRRNLLQLSQIPKVKGLVEEVRRRKQEIIASRRATFEREKERNFEEFKRSLLRRIGKKIERIEGGDLERVRERIGVLKRVQHRGVEVANRIFQQLVEELGEEIEIGLKRHLSTLFRETHREIEGSQREEVESYIETIKVEEEGMFGTVKRFLGSLFGTDWGYQTKEIPQIRRYKVVRAGIVRSAIEGLVEEVERRVKIEARQILGSWKQKLRRELVGELRAEIGDQNLEVELLSSGIGKVINSLQLPQISYSNQIPESLNRTGTLEGMEGEIFLNEAIDFLSSLRERVREDIGEYRDNLIETLSQIQIGEEIFNAYTITITQLERELLNRESILSHYRKLTQTLERI